MRRGLVGMLLVTLLVGLPGLLQAQHVNPWLIRVRGVVIAPDASSKPSGLDVKADATVEVDFSYAFSRWLSAEIIAATASQEVKAGKTSLGSVNHLPPTLLLQFHPVSHGTVRPYLGAGGNVTVFYAKSGGLEALDLTTSVGWAAQGGIDFSIGPRAVFNLDAKYVNIQTDVKSGGAKVYDLKINPWVFGAGFGYRF